MDEKRQMCERCGEWLTDLVYPEGADAVPPDVSRHLEGCAECRARVEETRRLLDVIRRADLAAAPPPGLEDRIMAAIEREEAGRAAPAVSRRRERRAALRAPRPGLGGRLLAWTRPLVRSPVMAMAASVLVVGGFLLLLREVVERGGGDRRADEGQGQVLVRPAPSAPPVAAEPVALREEPAAATAQPEAAGPREQAIEAGTGAAAKGAPKKAHTAEERSAGAAATVETKADSKKEPSGGAAGDLDKLAESGKEGAKSLDDAGGETGLALLSQPADEEQGPAPKKEAKAFATEGQSFAAGKAGGVKQSPGAVGGTAAPPAKTPAAPSVPKSAPPAYASPSPAPAAAAPPPPAEKAAAMDAAEQEAPKGEKAKKKAAESKNDLSTAAAADPYEAALAAYQKGDADGAIALLTKIVNGGAKTTHTAASTYHLLAKAWRKKGNNGKALVYYENLFARFPSYGSIDHARWEAAELYIQTGDKKRARALLEKLLGSPAFKDKAQKKLDSL